MPEGDTIFRTATVLRGALVGRQIVEATARPGPGIRAVPRVGPLIGSSVTAIESRGKHLLIGFSTGTTLHTHLGLHGSWHRYARGERWLRAARSAAIVLGTDDTLVACFRPSRIELVPTRAAAIQPGLRELGPDLLGDDFDASEAMRRLRQRDAVPISEALLDQRAVAGIGNVYRSELLFLRGIEPSTPVAAVPDEQLLALLGDARRLLAANVRGGARRTTGTDRRAAGGALWVYGRTGRPCRHCGSAIRSRRQGPLARVVYWCPSCQPASADGGTSA